MVAAWTHGMGNQRAWWSSHSGMDINHTAQLVLAKSTDDGKTWSKPINITEQVKDPSWYFLLQGPGRGITMSDGTLVFPTQFIDSTRVRMQESCIVKTGENVENAQYGTNKYNGSTSCGNRTGSIDAEYA